MNKYKNTLVISLIIIISSNLSGADEIRTQFDEAKTLGIIKKIIKGLVIPPVR